MSKFFELYNEHRFWEVATSLEQSASGVISKKKIAEKTELAVDCREKKEVVTSQKQWHQKWNQLYG